MPQHEFKANSEQHIRAHEYKECEEEVDSNANDVISVLRTFQKKNPWIMLTDDVFSYNNWPETIDWEFVLLKLQQLKVYSYNRVQILLLAGIVITDRGLLTQASDWRGANAFHYAALSGNPKAVEALMALGFDKDAKDNFGTTVLHYAARSGNPNAVEALMALGFDKNAKDNNGATVLHYAALSGNPKAVEALMALGFDKNTKDNNGATVLHYAAWSGNPKAVEALIALGFDKNAKNNNGATVLHYAARSGNPKAVEALIALGFDKDIKDDDGATVLHYAARSGNPKAVEALIALGFDKDIKDDDGNTILHDAAWIGSCSTMTMLIEQYGLKPDAKNKSGGNILDWAKQGRHQLAIDFCTDTIHTTKLYRNYLASFTVPAIPYEVAIPDIANIIGEYAAPRDNAEQAKLEKIVQDGVEIRNGILKPLISFCNVKICSVDGRRGALNEILASKELDVIDLERRLDSMLKDKSHQNKPHSYSLLQCRFNTAQKTGNTPKDTANNFMILEQELKSTNEDLRGLRWSHQGLHHGLQTTHRRLQANFAFQYKLLIALSAVSVVALTVGAWAALDAGQEGAGGALIAVNVVVAGLVCYSIYNNSRTRAKVLDEAKHEEAELPADAP